MLSNANLSVNEFTDELWRRLDQHLHENLQACQKRGESPVAVFDADGTLWDEDAGEAFFRWQIENCGFELPADPWKHYFDWKARDPLGAYGWLAQISAGQSVAQVREWATACARSHAPWPVFASQKLLLKKLQAWGVEVYVVTASVKWAVEPFALEYFGIPYERVIGIECELDPRDVLRAQVKLPITWRDGKAQALRAKIGHRQPILSCGNTYGDIALIETAYASGVRLMIQTRPDSEAESGLGREEAKLRAHGRALNWWLHSFRR